MTTPLTDYLKKKKKIVSYQLWTYITSKNETTCQNIRNRNRNQTQKNQQYKMGRVKRIWYLSPMRAAKIQTSLRIRAVSSAEPPLLAHTSRESRGTFRQKARSLAPLNGWACAVKFVMTECLKTHFRLTRHKWNAKLNNAFWQQEMMAYSCNWHSILFSNIY